jgi:sec-independent protein translocase protein TatB
MFDIGWTEMLVIAVVMIVVVGPKDLPKMLRTFGRTTTKLRAMAGDFQKQFNEALKEAELDDVKKSVDSLRSMNPVGEIKKQLNPFEKAAADVRAGIQNLQAQSKPADQASPTPVAAEPLKNGAIGSPVEGPVGTGDNGPTAAAAMTPLPAAPASVTPPAVAAKPAKAAAAAKPASPPKAKAPAKSAPKPPIRKTTPRKAAAPKKSAERAS